VSWNDLNARFRPISNWPGESTRERQRSRFDTPWRRTLQLFAREVQHIIKPGEIPILEIAVSESQIRIDGYPKANARPSHPGVILSLESKYGPLRYPCDNFDDWQDNIRALALSLEALRKVDRYGVTQHGEQYEGWKALPPAGGSTVTMTAQVAADIIACTAGRGDEEEVKRDILHDRQWAKSFYLEAAKFAHPDCGGTAASFQRLQTAKTVLDAHHG